MKNIVVYDDVREIEIRPDEAYKKYITLMEKEVLEYFSDKSKLLNCQCPGCSCKKTKMAFTKFGMNYVQCEECLSLFVSPRPDQESLNTFFSKSPAKKYWIEKLAAQTEAKRKDKIYEPRLDWIEILSAEYFKNIKNYMDINTAYFPFLQLLKNRLKVDNIFCLDTFSNISEKNPGSGIKTAKTQDDFKEFKGKIEVISAFEVINYISDVENFVDFAYEMLVKGGLLLINTLSMSGLDMQILWDKSTNIYPPDRLNLLSTEGLSSLFSRKGFEIIELSTPGLLDVDIVANSIKIHPSQDINRFIKYILTKRDDYTKNEFQNFLQQNRLSSFVRMAMIKK